MKLRQPLRASLACTLALFSLHASADPAFPQATQVLHIDGGAYTTDWTAYPLRVDQVSASNQRAQKVTLGLFQDGKEGEFQGIVQIDCDQPTHSLVTTGSSGAEQFHAVPLKNLMKRTLFPRKLVSNLFAVFCTGSTLDAAAVNMKRD